MITRFARSALVTILAKTSPLRREFPRRDDDLATAEHARIYRKSSWTGSNDGEEHRQRKDQRRFRIEQVRCRGWEPGECYTNAAQSHDYSCKWCKKTG